MHGHPGGAGRKWPQILVCILGGDGLESVHIQSLWTHQATQRLKGSGKKKIHPSGGTGRRHDLSVRERKAWGELDLRLPSIRCNGQDALSQWQESNLPSPSSQLVPRGLLPPHSLSPGTFFLHQTTLLPKQAATRGSSIQTDEPMAAILLPSATARTESDNWANKNTQALLSPPHRCSLLKAMEGCYVCCVVPV